MERDQFMDILDAQITRVRDILVVKTEEYATEDQLANVRFMAWVQGISFPRAIAGAMAKHTFSVYKMIRDGKAYPIEKWDEKITDHIIWLVLLRASLIENAENPLDAQPIDVLRATANEFPADSYVEIDGHQISTSQILQYAALILEGPKSNPDQERMPC